MNTKKRFKLYKHGKLWCAAAILFGAFVMGTASGRALVKADTRISQPASSQVVNVNNDQAANSMAAEQAVNTQSGNDQDAIQANNEVPVDPQVQASRANVNEGYIDSSSWSQNAQGQPVLHASGWHISGKSNTQRYRYAIVYDNTTHRELHRQAVQPQTRLDVARVKPGVANAGNSGFNLAIGLPNADLSHSLSLVLRYSDDPLHGEGNNTSYWFRLPALDAGNYAWLDNISTDADHNTVTVSGWHASNQAATRPYHYLIAYDRTRNRELARVRVTTPLTRNDVAQAHPQVFNAGRSGFAATFRLNPAMVHDQIQFLSRWTNDPAGNGSAIDYWFSPVDNQGNYGWQDDYNLSSGNLQVSGWHASNAATFAPHHFLIVWDQTAHRQVACQTVDTIASPDVARAHRDIATAGQSRFNTTLSHFNMQPGHHYQLISRYSQIATGNGDNGTGVYVDYWYPAFNLAQNQMHGWIDGLAARGQQLTVHGWMASDDSAAYPYAYVIMRQGGVEKERQRVNLTARPDVAAAYPHVYNSLNSAFAVTFDLAKLDQQSSGDLQFVLRFTDDPVHGEGHYAQLFEPAYHSNVGGFDRIAQSSQGLQLTGWHAAAATTGRPYQYLIAVNADNGHELGRWQLHNAGQARADIAQQYPWIANAGQSGFTGTIPQARFNSHFVRFIHRYTDDPAGNGHFLDTESRTCYFNPQLVTNQFLSLPNQDKTVYFGNDGQMALGNVVINGQTYHFDGQTGKIYSFSQRVIDWFRNRRGRLTYSQWGTRNGSDGTADCSGAITQAIRDAGGYDYGHIYHDNYDTKHADFFNYIRGNGYHQVYEGTGQYTPQYGDIVVWNPWGGNGREGHAMVISSFGPNPNVISVCGYTHEQPGTAVQEFNYQWYWNYDGRPNQLVFRPNDLSRA